MIAPPRGNRADRCWEIATWSGWWLVGVKDSQSRVDERREQYLVCVALKKTAGACGDGSISRNLVTAGCSCLCVLRSALLLPLPGAQKCSEGEPSAEVVIGYGKEGDKRQKHCLNEGQAHGKSSED